MKKLFVLFLAALVAGLSQAVTVDWDSGDLTEVMPPDATSVTAYYIVLDASAAEQMEGKTSQEIYYTYFNEDNTLKTGVEAAEVAMNGLGGAHYSQDIGDNSSAYVVAIYKADSAWGGSYALATVATYDEAGGEFEDPDVSTNGDIAATALSNGATWAPVPEPTTVALLALGLAAIGLKRKVA